jgi:large subunit ribosomal protein L3
MSLSESLGLLGRKVGMMRIFTDDGDAIPVTVLDVSNNRVTQVKTVESDGYNALQVAFGTRKASRVNKPEAGHLAKAGVEGGEILKEFRVSADTVGQYKAGRHHSRGHVRRRPEGRRAGHVDRQGLRGHHQAPQLQLAARVARQQPFAQRAGLDLDGAGPGSCVPGQEDDRPHGRRDRHHAEPRHRPCGRGASLLLVRGAVPGSKNGHVVVRPAVKAPKA